MMFKCVYVCANNALLLGNEADICIFLVLETSCETTKPTKNVIIENIRDRMILRLFSVIIVVVILALVLVAL